MVLILAILSAGVGRRGEREWEKAREEEVITEEEGEEEYPCNRMRDDKELRVARLGATGRIVCRVPRKFGTSGAFQFVRRVAARLM